MMRLLVVGNSSVGKTCLLRRFSEGTFNTGFVPTIGIDFAVKNIKYDNKVIKVQIFDTAGQERFKRMQMVKLDENQVSQIFLGILLVFDIHDKESFEDCEQWYAMSKENSPDDVKLILVGNKVDLDSERAVSYDQASNFAKKKDMVYIETSAKTQQNVNEAFEAIVRDIYTKRTIENPQKYLQGQQANNPLKNVQQVNQKKKHGSCYC